MTAQRNSVERVFAAAAPLTPHSREAVLTHECGGDAALRREVESLLAEHDAGGSFLESPPAEVVGTPAATDAPRPRQIGPYRIVRLLGVGGMGAVYLAEQDEPIRRRVALKLLAPALSVGTGRDLKARFEAERQTLALLDHPGVARVLDAGNEPGEEGGRPFLVMEFVDGQSITDACRDLSPDVEARLGLMIAVCEAVHHAHQKGVIHRDLKPGNILVQVVEDRLHPRIIDFGIAKLFGDVARSRNAVTEAGAMLGTPEYMSPEQAGGAPGAVDTRADVYALGMVLYEVLAGTPAMDAAALRSGGLDGMLRVLRTVDPPRPSERAASPGYPAPIPARRLRGDLDWIVMHAIEKDRERRYASVMEFADDLRRHISHRPVRARPPSTLYILRRFVRRRRGFVATIASVILALTIGLAAALHSYRAARRAEVLANERYNTMLTAMAGLTEHIGVTLAGIPGTSRAAAIMADGNLERVLALGARGDSDQAWELAAAYAMQRVGECRLVIGRTGSALAVFRESVRVRERSARRSPSDPAVARSLGVGWLKVAEAHAQMGGAAEALEANRLALAAFESLGDGLSPDAADRDVYIGRAHRSIGESLAELARPDEALIELETASERYRRGLASEPDNTVLIRGHSATLRDIAETLAAAGRIAEAHRAYPAAIAAAILASRVMGAGNAAERAALARCRVGLSGVLLQLQQTDAAAGEASEAIGIAADLAGADPDHVESHLLLARARLAHAHALGVSGRAVEASADAESAARSLRALAAIDPQHAGIAAARAIAEGQSPRRP